MLEARKFPPELLDLLKAITGCDDEQRIMLKCEPQIGPALVNVKRLIAKAKETKTAEEKKRQEKLQKIGKCVMGFDWLRVNGGYQCAGGSHFVTDNEMNSIEGRGRRGRGERATRPRGAGLGWVRRQPHY